MSLVEGIGDEVIEFFIALIVLIIGTVAWRSTRISDRPAIRTVFVFERRTQQTRTTPQQTSQIESETIANTSPSTEENKPSTASTSNPETQGSTSNDARSLTPEEIEQNTILENMDAPNIVNRRRLEYFNRRDTNGTNSTEGSVESIESICSNNSTVETNTDTDNETYRVEEKKNETNNIPPEESCITIKLKYINDDLKLVSGKLEELLGDFRRRNFEQEISSDKLVKLIFNGQVLQRDDVTLQSCGLFDNCVVHCLIHQKRPNHTDQSSEGVRNERNTSSQTNHQRSSSPSANRAQSREWDLGNLFFAIVSFILGAAWYFRYEYSQLYTVTATIALVGLTGIFTVLLVGMYFPDPDPETVQPPNQQATRT